MLVLQIIAAGAALSYVGYVVLTPSALLSGSGTWQWWGLQICLLLLIPPILLRARHANHLGAGWLFVAIFAALFQLGALFSSVELDPLTRAHASLIAQCCFSAGFVALVIGVAWLTQPTSGARMLSVRLDGAVVALAVGSAAAAIRFRAYSSVPGRGLPLLAPALHPLLDLTLLMLIVAGLTVKSFRPPLWEAVLMLGIAVFVLGDVLYAREQAINMNLSSPLLGVTLIAGLWLLSLGSWADSDRRTSARIVAASPPPQGLLMLPIGSGLVALAVVALSLTSEVPKVALILAAGSLLLVMARMTMTLREARQGSLNFRDARTDELTGLSNRRGFLEAMSERLTERSKTRPLAVLLVDLDGFKEVNDSLGHLVGDELLMIVAKRFASSLGREATVGRLGGDEFAAAIDVKSINDATEIANRLAETHSEPITLDGVTVRVSASYGIALFPAHGLTPVQLLRSADVAMYEAKNSHRTVCAYRSEQDRNTRSRLALVGELRNAIEANDLVLHYQPTRDLRTQAIRGVEALVRWKHPSRGTLQPDDFVPMAERVGLVPSLSRVVLDKAIAEAARLQRQEHPLQMSVNISRYDLLDESLTEFIANALSREQVSGETLTLEITESSIGEEPTRSRKAIEDLRELGLRVSIDDFGVGYSSMSQLLSLPLDEIKIDKSFILALRSDRRARAIISSAIELARALDLTLVAEGIESAQSLEVLEQLGADIGQGFYIAHPLTSAQLDDFLDLSWEGGLMVRPGASGDAGRWSPDTAREGIWVPEGDEGLQSTLGIQRPE
jgi:diguanylate cyclase (GGDEF)-like protein